MSAYFRLSLGERLRALFTGRVRRVSCMTPPVVFRQSYGGASCSIDADAFGWSPSKSWTHWISDLPSPRPYLYLKRPDAFNQVACPRCGQLVHPGRLSP